MHTVCPHSLTTGELAASTLALSFGELWLRAPSERDRTRENTRERERGEKAYEFVRIRLCNGNNRQHMKIYNTVIHMQHTGVFDSVCCHTAYPLCSTFRCPPPSSPICTTALACPLSCARSYMRARHAVRARGRAGRSDGNDPSGDKAAREPSMFGPSTASCIKHHQNKTLTPNVGKLTAPLISPIMCTLAISHTLCTRSSPLVLPTWFFLNSV